jgi:hypothetical protein
VAASRSRRALEPRSVLGRGRFGQRLVRRLPGPGRAVRPRLEHRGRADSRRVPDDDDRRHIDHRALDHGGRDGPAERRRPPRQLDTRFTLTQPIDVGTKPKEGERIQLTVTSDLTLHGVTKSVRVPIEARWTGSTIEATASFDVALADYAIDPSVGFLVLSIQDHGTIEMHLLLQKS